jgi:hypothetical protein
VQIYEAVVAYFRTLSRQSPGMSEGNFQKPLSGCPVPRRFEPSISRLQDKVNVKSSLCLTKQHAMNTYAGVSKSCRTEPIRKYTPTTINTH